MMRCGLLWDWTKMTDGACAPTYTHLFLRLVSPVVPPISANDDSEAY